MNGHYSVGDIVLNNWTLTRLLGQDSAGCVFEAVQNDSGLMNKAAIKILTVPQSLNDIMNIMADGMDKDSAVEYFKGSIGDLLEEFLLMTKLQNSPNIVNYDEHVVLQHTEGLGWDIVLRMELLTPLISYAQSGHLDRENIIKLGIDICHALESCEEYSIVHGDIKPGNIFLSEEGDFKLSDFSVSRTLNKTSSGFTKNAYTAPEIYRGESYRQGTDIYSLGIVLYWLLNNNRTPFMPLSPATITHNARDLALIRQLQGESFPKPENADDTLADVVLRASAFNPRKRYASPALLRKDLEAVLSGKEISAASAGAAADAGAFASAAYSNPDDLSPYDDYDSQDSESNFYDIIKGKSDKTFSSSSYSDYDDQPDIDDQDEFGQEESSRHVVFDDDLYDDDVGGGRKDSFVATALMFAKKNLAQVALVAAAVVVIVIAFLILNPFGSEEPPEPEPDPALEEEVPPQVDYITVPDFTGLTIMEILQNDQWQNVFSFNTMGEDFSDTVPEGSFISQSPDAHTEQQVSPLGERVRINLVVSLGPEPHPLQDINSVEIRHGVSPLPGRANNNPGLTLRMVAEPEIVLTARILPEDFDFEQFTPEELEQYIDWESTNEDIFEITAISWTDLSVRIEAVGTGNASLIIRIGELEDRVTVTVAN